MSDINKKYYLMEKLEVLKELNTDDLGLSSDEAKKRLDKYGKNEIKEKESDPIWKIFLDSFKDPMVIILIVAAIIQIITGSVMESLIIFLVLILNAILGTVQTKKAESSINSLKQMSVPSAKVLRDGEKLTISSTEIVPGDIVILEAGDYVPADGRLLEAESLKIVEGMLTGESEPADKNTDRIETECTVGDRINMVYSTSMVVNGRATYVCTRTGMETEIGKIADLLENTEAKQTPLQSNIETFSKKLGIAIVAICVFIFAVQVFRAMTHPHGQELKTVVLNSFMFAVAIAVAAIPEALSSIVTIVLSMGTKIMSRKNSIIRKLPAVETLGSTSVICTDKTGTLTMNKMTAVKYYLYSNGEFKSQEVEESERLDSIKSEFLDSEVMLNYAAALCNDSSINEEGVEIGDPTEVALTVFANKKGYITNRVRETFERIQELPFDSDRKLMSTTHKINGKDIMFTKGAPDIILSRSKKVLIDSDEIEMSTELLEKIKLQNEEYSNNALRVLAFGYKEFDGEKIDIDFEDDFVFIGLIAMIDPPRKEVVYAVSKAKNAGIKPIMITGDHKTTAVAIGREIGIFEEGDLSYTGQELDNISDSELDENLERISVYARVSPQNKIRIVSAWQKKNKVTAMTGDGVNDAPALKNADIGIGMGSGTEVAKDASAMVLVDDNFASIIDAIEVGRTVYSNIKKSITYLFSGNLGAIISILFAVFVDWTNPYTALQLIFINMVNDSLPAIALGMEKPENGIMNIPPRDKNEGLLGGGTLISILSRGIFVGIAAILAQFIGLQHSPEMGVAMAFTTLLLSRTFQTFACRSDFNTSIEMGIFGNKYVIIAILVCLALLGFVLLPFIRPIFAIPATYSVKDFGISLSIALLSVICMEITKKIRFRKQF
ncbi:cation-translocating P-type ATPase [Peptostreptococcus canis]|uniref:Cation-translocating P-type ATPase n=1 Tax=Peptostreptococcus canis TaxID=1159213 RepID=A0ABR6TKX6_9FIRM|nr:cation-translocating P-type ATPase [Peptostreptococcus canis]MBC2576060.1 cation-translocating P-type ATPase [Peptostreptococcus canis]MBP1997814.1 Ca2+-transporting ATPase [Peptostreptococcus canis]